MKILLIFDNLSCNKKWGNLLNIIKRWMLYYLNNEIINNNIEFIKIIKSNPFKELVLEDPILNNNSINEIIKFFSDIIYKYSTDNNIINLLNLIDDKIEYDEIIIFSLQENLYNEEINEKINEKLVNENIKNIKIFNFNYTKIFYCPDKINNEIIKDRLVSKNIQEIIINNKINDFTEIISIINNNLLLIKDYSQKESSSKNNLDKISKILKEYYKIECEIIKNINNLISCNELLERLNLVKDDNLYLKYCYNVIKNKLINLNTKKIITNNFDINSKIFKYIFDFYEIIYPKIYSELAKNNLIYEFSINNPDISDIIFNEYTLSLKKDDTERFLTSSLSMTNWKEEIIDLNCFGFMINYKISKLSYKGYIIDNDKILSSYPNIGFDNISNNFVSLNDYYQLIINHLEEEPDFKFNLNNFEVMDNLHGNTNIMLPLYINKEHWTITKKIWNFHFTLINNCLEPYYKRKMDNIYFYVLLKYFNILLGKNKITQEYNITSIRLFMYILRTTIQICIDNKYCFNILSDYNKHKEMLLVSEDIKKFKIIFNEYLIRLLQLIITSKYDNTNTKIDLLSIKKKFLELKLGKKILNEELKDYSINEEILNFIDLEYDLIQLSIFMNELFKIKGFNQLIKILDNDNGLILENSSTINYSVIKDILKNNIIL
jgi:hypothetical protein